MEGSGGDFESPAHGVHHLQQRSPQMLSALREDVLYMILLDLHKAYEAFDRSRCLETLEGYGVGPRDQRLL